MDTFEIKDEEINVEKIMEKIRENIKKRKEEGVYAENEPAVMNQTFSSSSPILETVPEDSELLNTCDISNDSYVISSHRPVLGKFLVEGRKMVHGETRRYVDPVFQKQREFNFNAADKIKHLNNDVKNLNTTFEDLKTDSKHFRTDINDLKTHVKCLNNDIENLKSSFEHFNTDTLNTIHSEINSFISSVNMDLNNKSWLNSILEKRLKENLRNHEAKESEDNKSEDNKSEDNKSEDNKSEINYYVFEERFRGPRDNVQQHQKVFLDYFKDCKNVLDIGCGRGEFLELAMQNGIVAKGIDIDEDMISFCKSKNFNVELKDAIEALEGFEDKSLDGVFISQVVEHLDPNYLIQLLNLCNKKLKYGFYLVVETVNPLSLFSFANFYIDLTHIKPIHPETLKFLLSAVDFREIETKFISPVPDSMRLKKIPASDLQDRDKVIFETYNQNIDMLNNILYGAQDYAVIGKK